MMTKPMLPKDLIGEFFGVGSIGEDNPQDPLQYIKELRVPYVFQVTSLSNEDMIRQFGYLVDGFEEDGDFILDIDIHDYREITTESSPLTPDMDHSHSLHLLVDGTSYNYFKTQQTAPNTMCYSTRGSDGKQHLTKAMFHLYSSLMTRIAQGQIDHLQAHCKNIIFCQDDPSLGLVIQKLNQDDCFDLSLAEILRSTERIYPSDTIPAYHYCDDWRELTINGKHLLWDADVKIAHIDLVSYPPEIDNEQAERLNKFIERGGALAVGVLPNVDDSYTTSVLSTLEHNLSQVTKTFQESGVSIDLLSENSMVSTQCGLSRASTKLTREIHKMSHEFSTIFKRIMEESI